MLDYTLVSEEAVVPCHVNEITAAVYSYNIPRMAQLIAGDKLSLYTEPVEELRIKL